MSNSFLPLALATGNLTVLTDCEAKSVVGEEDKEGWTASGVAVSPRDAGSRSATAIKARRIIVAAGAFFSSAVLLRSPSFPNRQSIGQKIYLQPHAQVFGLFDEPMTTRGTIEDGQYVPLQRRSGHLQLPGFFKGAPLLVAGEYSLSGEFGFVCLAPPAARALRNHAAVSPHDEFDSNGERRSGEVANRAEGRARATRF